MRNYTKKAKQISNGKWVIGYYQQRFKEDETIEHLMFIANSYLDWSYVEIDPETLCDPTGIFDKNGIMIWENDIINKSFYTDYDACADSEEYTGVVKFFDCAWVIECQRNGYICRIPIFESMSYTEDVEHFEVIGNIFDNSNQTNPNLEKTTKA